MASMKAVQQFGNINERMAAVESVHHHAVNCIAEPRPELACEAQCKVCTPKY